MNLFYFNGNNGETKTLSQVVGQYCVITNLSTEVNNKLIFAVYTKGSPFFTTRITHSPPSNVDMIAGGKYLLYWGDIPSDIYPNLPRLNFTDITTTGPAVGTEEILSVSLNSDSGATASSIIILIESLGVVFSDGSVNQSRVYNLITDNTEYELLNNIQQTVQGINQKIGTTDGGINSYIINFPASQTINGEVSVSNQNTNYALEADGNLEEIRNKTDNFNFNDNNGVLELNVFDIQNNAKLDSIETYTSKLDDLTYTDNNLNVNIASGTLTVDSVKIQASNGDNLTATGSSLNTNITNTSIDVHNKVFHNSSWINLVGASNGHLIVNSSTQDGDGTDITSTDLLNSKRGLDTASSLFGYSGSARTALTCDIGGKLLITSYTSDDLGNGITSSATSTSVRSLDTASSLYVSNGTARTALTATGSSLDANITNTITTNSRTEDGSGNDITSTDVLDGKRGLDTASAMFAFAQGMRIGLTTDLDGKLLIRSHNYDYLNNGISSTTTSIDPIDPNDNTNSLDTASSLYVSNGTARTALTATGSSLDANITNTSIPVTGNFFQTVQPISLRDGTDHLLTSTDTTATQRSLDTASALYTTDASTRSALTSTAISSIRALDVNVANSSVPVTFSNTTIGISGTASVSDTTSQGYLNTINSAIGDNSGIFQTGNLINNGSINATSFSTERNFTRGTYKRNTLIIYRDSNTSNTGSISVYSLTTSGTPSNVLLGTFYPISNGTFRQFTGTFNLLPFASLFIRNDSDTTITSVYVSYVNG